jgi:hypothetical protein
MANNRKTFNGRKIIRKKQLVYSEPQYIQKEKYLTPKGKKLLTKVNKKEIWEKYGKIRYKLNSNAKVIKVIYHNV